MSNRYQLSFNVTTVSREAAYIALGEVARIVEEKCIVENSGVGRPNRAAVFSGRVLFLAANDAEAADLARRAQTLPGLPPMDAVSWRLVKADA